LSIPTQLSHFGSATVALLLIVGCGGADDGPAQYHISGAVTHKGAPVAQGVIYFNPKDGVNPSGYAAIVDGKYDTVIKGKGHSGGAHDVRIAVEAPDGIEVGWTPPFKPYETSAALPTETSTEDFDVPDGKK